MSMGEAVDGSRGLARFAGRTRSLSWDPFILPQACAPSRRHLATRTTHCFRPEHPGLVGELREARGGTGTQTWTHSGTMGA